MGKKNGKRFHFLYKTTNTLNGKYYYGVHSTYNLKDGYLGSGKILTRAVEKYGKEHFKNEILEYFETREELLKKEKEVVNEQLINDPLCMNLMLGGIGGATMTGRKQSKETVEKRVKHLRGIKRTKKTKEKISKSVSKTLIGNKRAIGSKGWVGRKHNETSKKLMQKNNPLRKEVGLYDENHNLLSVFISLHDAELKTGIPRNKISKYCKGIIRNIGNHIWKFI